jgi:hypothetical protein
MNLDASPFISLPTRRVTVEYFIRCPGFAGLLEVIAMIRLYDYLRQIALRRQYRCPAIFESQCLFNREKSRVAQRTGGPDIHPQRGSRTAKDASILPIYNNKIFFLNKST